MLNFIKAIQNLDIEGNISGAQSKLNSYIFELYLKKNIIHVDLFIKEFLKYEFSLELLISLARVTKPYKTELQNRPDLISILNLRLEIECTELEAKHISLNVF